MGKRVKLLFNQGGTDSVENGRGVRLECCMSHIFLNLYGEYLMKESLAEVVDFKIGGRIYNKVRSAEATAITARTQEELQDMVKVVCHGNQN